MRLPSYEEVAELLDYNPDTGEFIRKKRTSNSIKVGDTAGTTNSEGYRQVSIRGKQYYAHRLAWLLHYGEWPRQDLDHINHTRADNRITNLRLADRSTNMKNSTKRADNTSGICGVYWYKPYSKWMALLGYEGGSKFLGYFDTIEEAATARLAANKQHGFHENHGI